MKHVFVIHSNTVLLSSLGVVEKEMIAPKDTVFLYGRGFYTSLIDKSIKTIDASRPYGYGQTKGFVMGRSLKNKLVQEVDALIAEEVGDEFKLYIPHTGSPFFQALATNRHCASINLIQEGAVAYITKPLNNPWKVKFINCFFSTKRFWSQENWCLPHFIRKKIKIDCAYALNESYFGNLASRNIVINWPFFSNPKFILPPKSKVFLFEAAVELGQIEKDIYLKGCELLVSSVHSECCFVKFHPNQSDDNKKIILSLFKGKKVEILKSDIPFEIIMSSSKQLMLYGFTTSLLTFGENMGHTIISYKKFLCSNSKKFQNYCNCQS